MSCRWKKTMTTSLAVSLSLETVVSTKSSQLTYPRLRRIHLLPQFRLLKRLVRALDPLQHQQESIRKTGSQTTSIEAGHVLLDFRRTYAHERARQLARPLPPARHCHHRNHRVCFSTGQAIIGFPHLVSQNISRLGGGNSTEARWSDR
jgi:hypothetical protein